MPAFMPAFVPTFVPAFMLFLILLVPEGLRVHVMRFLLVVPIGLPGHLLLDAIQDQLGLLLDHVAEVLVVDLHLEGVVEAKLLPLEGVVELVAVVDPTLRNHRQFLVEQLVQLLLLLQVVFAILGLGRGRRQGRFAVSGNHEELRSLGLLHQVVGPDHQIDQRSTQSWRIVSYCCTHLLRPPDSVIVVLVLPLAQKTLEFHVFVKDFSPCVLICQIYFIKLPRFQGITVTSLRRRGLFLLLALLLLKLVGLERLEEVPMDLLQGVGCKDEKIVIPIIGLHDAVLLLGELKLDLLELLDQLPLNLSHRDLLAAQVVRDVVVARRRRGVFFVLSHLAQEVVVLPREEPGGGVVPHVPAVVQDQVVLRPAGKDLVEGLRLEVAVLVTTDDVGGERFLVLQEQQLLRLPREVGVTALLPSVLRPDVLANLLCVDPRALGVDIDLVELGEDVDEVLEVGPHLDYYQVPLPLLLLQRTLYLGNEVEVLEGDHALQVQLANLAGVQDGVVEVQDNHGLVVLQQVLDVHLLVLPEGTPRHQHVPPVGLVLEEITRELIQVFLLHLLHAKLTPLLKYLLVLADHLPNLDNNSLLPQLLPVLAKIEQEGGLGKVGKSNFLVIHLADLRSLGELLVEGDAPVELVQHRLDVPHGVYLAQLSQ